MEGAETFKAATTGGLKVDVIADDIVDSGTLPNQIDVSFSNTTHGAIVGVSSD